MKFYCSIKGIFIVAERKPICKGFGYQQIAGLVLNFYGAILIIHLASVNGRTVELQDKTRVYIFVVEKRKLRIVSAQNVSLESGSYFKIGFLSNTANGCLEILAFN